MQQELRIPSAPEIRPLPILQLIGRILLLLGAAVVLGVLVWQGITAAGAPDPTAPHTSSTRAIFDIGVLVFREGLECILVLSAITASMVGAHETIHKRAVAA
ncbi:MAG: hypothetical protein JO076_08895, partial [Verrucomicrobia bacterium]|nr:hypothetical protein [Verrucomicrobiota bacterium]